ncbi:hypothetical protein BJ875DRAFT_481645 [Amylocarpus encephaloides]|uniref:Uncharacterized protein n=1 Tax=Amylocarpus encephaloides TaxID=45428 RepID=A0A9P8C877_9HELO|nr:hypothetical protein BJ875DRAFT_481645 [Amylocarpus encephaloides]
MSRFSELVLKTRGLRRTTFVILALILIALMPSFFFISTLAHPLEITLISLLSKVSHNFTTLQNFTHHITPSMADDAPITTREWLTLIHTRRAMVLDWASRFSSTRLAEFVTRTQAIDAQFTTMYANYLVAAEGAAEISWAPDKKVLKACNALLFEEINSLFEEDMRFEELRKAIDEDLERVEWEDVKLGEVKGEEAMGEEAKGEEVKG